MVTRICFMWCSEPTVFNNFAPMRLNLGKFVFIAKSLHCVHLPTLNILAASVTPSLRPWSQLYSLSLQYHGSCGKVKVVVQKQWSWVRTIIQNVKKHLLNFMDYFKSMCVTSIFLQRVYLCKFQGIKGQCRHDQQCM